MNKIRSLTRSLIIFSIAVPVLYGADPAAETFEMFLRENSAANMRYENCTPEQQLEMRHRWVIYNERYNNLTLDEKHEIEAMRREREARWSRLSEHEKMELQSGDVLDP